MTAADLALQDTNLELLLLEDLAVESLQEAIAWRSVALMAIQQAAEQMERADKLERRLHQILGADPWHTSVEMES